MSIKAAIEALDMATKGPWKLMRAKMPVFDGSDVLVAAEPDQKTGTSGRCLAVITDENHVEPHDIPNATIIAAAPQMAALIKKATPYLERCRAEVRQIIAMDWHDKGFEAELAELDALLKEAGE